MNHQTVQHSAPILSPQRNARVLLHQAPPTSPSHRVVIQRQPQQGARLGADPVKTRVTFGPPGGGSGASATAVQPPGPIAPGQVPPPAGPMPGFDAPAGGTRVAIRPPHRASAEVLMRREPQIKAAPLEAETPAQVLEQLTHKRALLRASMRKIAAEIDQIEQAIEFAESTQRVMDSARQAIDEEAARGPETFDRHTVAEAVPFVSRETDPERLGAWRYAEEQGKGRVTLLEALELRMQMLAAEWEASDDGELGADDDGELGADDDGELGADDDGELGADDDGELGADDGEEPSA